MPSVVDKRSLVLPIKRKSSNGAGLASQFETVLTNRRLAMEQVFTLTHGRRMTKAERRRFEETGD